MRETDNQINRNEDIAIITLKVSKDSEENYPYALVK